jgi:hypothetical protein
MLPAAPSSTEISGAKPQSVQGDAQTQPDHPLCTEAQSQLHGLGLFSRQKIERGTLILSEKPLLNMSAEACTSAAVWKTFQQLPNDEQQDWMKLAYRSDSYLQNELAKEAGEKVLIEQCGKVLAKHIANARHDGITGNNILPRLGARLNHCCQPNAMWMVNVDTGYLEGESMPSSILPRSFANVAIAYSSRHCRNSGE